MQTAITYYSVISDLNSLRLSDRELQLLAFIATRGTITNPAAREEFCKTYKTSQAVIYNTIRKLKLKRLLVKESGRIKIIPALALDFSQSIVLKITLNNDTRG